MFKIVQETQDRHLWAAIYVGGCCKTTPKMIDGLARQRQAAFLP